MGMKFFKGDLGTGLAIGIGAAVVGPMVLGALSAILRPMAKAAIKSGLMAYDRGREMVAEVREMGEDLAAEARSEIPHRERQAEGRPEGAGEAGMPGEQGGGQQPSPEQQG